MLINNIKIYYTFVTLSKKKSIEASVKEGLLCHGLKPNFHRYIGQLRRPLSRLQKTA
jgi:hypothetical protein